MADDDTGQWRYDKLRRAWTTTVEPAKVTEPRPTHVPQGTAYGDWPRCAWPAGCTIGVRDGGLCSPHQDLVLAYGHDPRPDPASKATIPWRPCLTCGARTTWHGRLSEVEEAAAVVWLEDNPTYQLVPSAPSDHVLGVLASAPAGDLGTDLATAKARADAAYAPHSYVANGAKPTAVAAAVRAAPGSGTQRGRVLRCIVDAGEEGATDEQIMDRLGMPLNTVRPRRLELVEQGYVFDSGDTRPTAAGNAAIVWVPTLDGLLAVES